MTHLQLGQRILDIYVCESLLGTGGMAEVWRVRHEAMGARFAMKVPVGNDAWIRAMFQREAHAMAKLSHRNLVQLLDYGELESGQPYIVMELVRGRSLQQILRADGPLPWRRAVLLMRQVLEGLTAIHAAGMVHRDIKPANLVVTTGPPESIKIIDLGVSCSLPDPRMARRKPTPLVGTAGFMAPEVIAGAQGDQRADLYAVGAVFEAAVLASTSGDPSTLPQPGRVQSCAPVEYEDADSGTVARPERVDNSDIPTALHGWTRAMTSSNPALRPASSQQAAAMLARVSTGPSRCERSTATHA